MVDGIVDLAEAATGAKAEAQAMAATAMEDVNKAGAGAPGGDGGDGGGDRGAGAAMEEEANGDKGDIAMEDDAAAIAAAAANLDPAMNFVERAKYIPLRLDMEERKLLRLLEAAMHVSEYTVGKCGAVSLPQIPCIPQRGVPPPTGNTPFAGEG